MKKLLLTFLLLFGLGLAASAQLSDELTTANFTGITYTTSKTYTADSKAQYLAQASSNNGFQLRTSKSGTGIKNVTAPEGHIIESVEITMSRAGGGVNVYAADETISLNSLPSATVGTVNSTATTTININKPYFAITATNDTYCIVSKVVVNWRSNIADERIEANLEWSATDVKANIGENFEAPTLTVTPEAALAEVVYSSSNESVATITDGVVEILATGVTTIKASISNSETYQNASTEYTLTIVDPNATDAAFIFENRGYSNQQEISTVVEGIVTLSFDKGSNSNTPKYFTNGKDVRLYGGGSLTITVPEGYALVKIESAFNNKNNSLNANYGKFNTDLTLWTADKDANSVKFTESGTSGNRSWTSIKVYYKVLTVELVGISHNPHFNKTNVVYSYTLHVNNHIEGRDSYEAVLTVNGQEFRNTEHTLATDAPAESSMLREQTFNSTHKLNGIVKATGLDGNTEYAASFAVLHNGTEIYNEPVENFKTGTVGIEDVTVDGNEAAEYFNLQGVRVAQPEAGRVYIVRRGAKATKELVK